MKAAADKTPGEAGLNPQPTPTQVRQLVAALHDMRDALTELSLCLFDMEQRLQLTQRSRDSLTEAGAALRRAMAGSR